MEFKSDFKTIELAAVDPDSPVIIIMNFRNKDLKYL